MGMRKDKRFTLDKLIELYEISNQAEAKSGKTITWYRYILTAFIRYAQQKWDSNDISGFSISIIFGNTSWIYAIEKASRDIHTH